MTAVATVMLLGSMINAVIAVICWTRRQTAGAVWLMAFSLAIGIWCFACVWEALAQNVEGKIFWSQVSYFGIATGPSFFFLFALDHGRRQSRTRGWQKLAFFLIPLATIVLVLTNSQHGWIWSEVTMQEGKRTAYYGRGPWFWVYTTHCYVLVVAGYMILFLKARQFAAYYKQQIAVLVVSISLPTLANLLYLLRINPLTDLDLTPLALSISAALIFWGLSERGILKLIPVARDQLLETLPDPVMVIDAKQQLLDANHAMRAILGMPEGEVIGKTVRDILPPDFHWQHLWTDWLLGKSLEDRQWVHEGRIYSLHGKPLYDRHRHFISITVRLHDISSQVAARDRLEKITAALQQRNQDLEAFSQTVAHDLKSPLVVINNLVQLLALSNPATSNRPEDYDRISRQLLQTTDKACRIIDSILMFSKLEKSQAQFEAVGLDSVIREVLARVEPQRAAVKAVITVASDWPAVVGHAPWLEEALYNYISNAIKFGGDQLNRIAPQIGLSWEILSCARNRKQMVRIWVQDNGIGIDPAKIHLLFNEFTRLQNENLIVEGTGLGLSIVRRIVEKMGGSAGAESNPAQTRGARFWLELPIAAE